MRDTGPVTMREHRLTPGQNLVSTTDLKGRILHCNPAFVAASGYSREELLGQPHNLIRHRDMPVEAFRDLWDTIASGEPWTGLVKNRRKDGDHYWVRANVTPLLDDGGRVVAYMSVRTVPERHEIEAAEALYRQLRGEELEGRPRTWRLRQGEPVRCGAAGRWQRVRAALLARRRDVWPLLATGVGVGITAAFGLRWGLAAGIPAALLACQVQRRLAQAPLRELLRFAQRMAGGDLTQRAALPGGRSGGLEVRLQQALNQLNVNLQTVVGDARSEAERVRGAVTEIAAGNRDLAGRTESQAGGLQQTVASIEQITGAVRQNAESAHEGASLAEQAVGVTEASRTAVQAVRATMHAIDESSRHIADITQVIDTISFQTNLLALNAAVEAARAGTAGRGFAVVAGEVRSLAASTTGAAKQIKGLIQQSQERIASGVVEVERAVASMDETSRSVQLMRDLAGGIRHASAEQLTAIAQVNDAMNALDGITRQNAAMVEQLSASAEDLGERAQVMQAAVQVFRTGGAIELPDAVALRRAARARVRSPADSTTA